MSEEEISDRIFIEELASRIIFENKCQPVGFFLDLGNRIKRFDRVFMYWETFKQTGNLNAKNMCLELAVDFQLTLEEIEKMLERREG